MYFIDSELGNYAVAIQENKRQSNYKKEPSQTKYNKQTTARCAQLPHISYFSSFYPLGFNTAVPLAVRLHAHHSHHSKKRPNKKKKVLPRSAAGHSVCVTMVIFNNATSSQSQPQLSRALSQLQKPHTNEGSGKNRSGEAEVGQDDSPTTNHMQNTHRGALTNTNTILSFDKGES